MPCTNEEKGEVGLQLQRTLLQTVHPETLLYEDIRSIQLKLLGILGQK